MQVGVGLPAAVPGTAGEVILEWARWAEGGPFASLGVLDRVAYDNYDPFVSLAAAAAVTSRLRLVTMVIIAPLRGPTLLAKEAASLDALSGGRLTLGLAIGARHEDYEVTGVDHADRGKRFDEQLAYLREAWEDGRIGPRPSQPDGPELLVGGSGARGQVRPRLRPRRRPAKSLCQRRLQGVGRMDRRRPPRPAAPVGPGVLRARRPARDRPGRRLPAGLLCLHGPVRRAHRGRQPDLAADGHRPGARLRGGGMRPPGAVADRRGPGAARAPGRRAGVIREGSR